MAGDCWLRPGAIARTEGMEGHLGVSGRRSPRSGAVCMSGRPIGSVKAQKPRAAVQPGRCERGLQTAAARGSECSCSFEPSRPWSPIIACSGTEEAWASWVLWSVAAELQLFGTQDSGVAMSPPQSMGWLQGLKALATGSIKPIMVQ
ncbi:hypothetical protein V500_10209 [Pseudogymnoascus sp. VKM F-4518 (FW-2643)]|nr:hypothetical protein V500_10209 [Pseudogymnoascus sp. VKM F-4518 (FW-2643)]